MLWAGGDIKGIREAVLQQPYDSNPPKHHPVAKVTAAKAQWKSWTYAQITWVCTIRACLPCIADVSGRVQSDLLHQALQKAYSFHVPG